jgi:hypothetical protein
MGSSGSIGGTLLSSQNLLNDAFSMPMPCSALL